MQTPAVFMDYLMVKDCTVHGGLAIFPLKLVSDAFEAKDPMDVIGNQIDQDRIYSTETGIMNYVRIVNRGALPLLAVDGTILIGGAANRMLTAGAVIQTDEIVNIPAVSVEANRWDCIKYPNGKIHITAPDPEFTGSHFAPATLRRIRLEKSMAAMKNDGISRANQSMIWKHIESLFEKSSITNIENLDVCQIYGHWEHLLEEYQARFNPVPDQVGCVVFIDRATWYLDVFYNSDVFQAVFPNLLKSYALEVIMARAGLAEPPEYKWVAKLEKAQDAFAKIKLIKLHTLTESGRAGEEVAFFSSKHACGTVFTDGDKLMHMTVCSRMFSEG